MPAKNLDGTPHCSAHCSGCDSHFRTVAAFDLHRAGSFKSGRRCRRPAQVKKLELLTSDGVCALRRGSKTEGVAIWKEAESG